MATRTITGLFTHADDTPWEGATVGFAMVEGTFTIAQTYPRDGVTAITDADGTFSVALTSGLSVYWHCTLPDGESFLFALPAGSVITLEELRSLSEGLPTPLTLPNTVVITSPLVDEILQYNGTQFVNARPETLTVSSGDVVSGYGGTVTPHHVTVRSGTTAAPKGVGNAFEVSLTSSVTRAEINAVNNGSDGASFLAAISGKVKGAVDTEGQPIGVYGEAQTSGVQSPTGGEDAVGVYGVGRVTGSGTGSAFGGFFLARNDSADGRVTAMEVHCMENGADIAYSPNTGSFGGAGIWLTTLGSKNLAAAINIGKADGAGRYEYGIAFPGIDAGGSVGAISLATIRDDGEAATVFDINGAHTNGLDMVGATISGRAIIMANTHSIEWNGWTTLSASASGNLILSNSAGNAFDRIMLGGTTATFPAIVRQSAFVEFKLADNSAHTYTRGSMLDITDGIAVPDTVAGFARIYVDVADGDLKVKFGDGTVKTISVDT